MNQTNKFRGLTPSQIKRGIRGDNIPKFKNLKTIKNSKKPRKEKRQQIFDNSLLFSLPFGTTQTAIQYPTPEWFNQPKKPDISIIVPIYNTDAANLITSWENTEEANVEIIFIDDNCPNDSKSRVLQQWEKKKQPVGKIYASTITQGWGVCCNIGAEKSSGDIIIFLHPDTVLTEGWMRPMTRLLRKVEVGAVGGINLEMDARTFMNAGMIWSWKKDDFATIGKDAYKKISLPKPFMIENTPKDLLEVCEREVISSFCMATKRDLFRYFGGFFPGLASHKWSDADFCLTLKERGLSVVTQGMTQVFRPEIQNKDKLEEQGKIFFQNKWVRSGRISRLVEDKSSMAHHVESIVVRRRAAHGDVLVATSVLPALKERYPKAKIYFNTDCPEILFNNPFVDRVLETFTARWFDIYFDLDMIYENRPNTNILTAYADACGVPIYQCKSFLFTESVKVPEHYVVVHAGKTMWAGRDWSSTKFDIVANRIQNTGHKIICVGTETDHATPCDIDLRGKTNIHQLAYVISKAKSFVGIDSFPMHIAQCFNRPGVCFFGSITPSTRLYSDKMRPVIAEGLRCLGCHHRKSIPCTATVTCDVGIQDCINNVTAEHMWREVIESWNS